MKKDNKGMTHFELENLEDRIALRKLIADIRYKLVKNGVIVAQDFRHKEAGLISSEIGEIRKVAREKGYIIGQYDTLATHNVLKVIEGIERLVDYINKDGMPTTAHCKVYKIVSIDD